MKQKTIEDIEAMTKEFLVPTDIAGILGCDPHVIRLQARADPAKLGFPVNVQNTRTRIPRRAFLAFIKWGNRDDCVL